MKNKNIPKPEPLILAAKCSRKRPFLARVKRGSAALKEMVDYFVPQICARDLQGKIWWMLCNKVYPSGWNLPKGTFTKIKRKNNATT